MVVFSMPWCRSIVVHEPTFLQFSLSTCSHPLALVVVLFFAAPHISEFFHEPILKPVTRVVSLSLILDAFVIVHRARLTIHVDFKSLAKVNVMTTLISGIVGISMAYLGYGVWSLVGQTLSRSFHQCSSFLFSHDGNRRYVSRQNRLKRCLVLAPSCWWLTSIRLLLTTLVHYLLERTTPARI